MDMDTRTNRRRVSGRAKTLRSAAIGLGIFSVGLGVVELLAPRAFARATGMRGREGMVRAYGVREIVSGLGLLARTDDPRPWLWARVAGDALDVSTLAARGFDGSDEARRARLGIALATPIGALDLLFALMAQSRDNARAGAVHDYSDRVGLGGSPEQMRGAARDAPVPRDMRTPAALEPWAVTS